MEELAELLFTFASVDRLILFNTISNEKLRLTQLAAKLSATTQETSRHLARLQEAGVIEKGVDGCLALTSFGRLVQSLLPSLEFLSKHREYFIAHDVSTLPPEFLERIGELEEGKGAHGVGAVLGHLSMVLREAKSYVWLISDNVMDLRSLGGTEVAVDFPIRIVVPAISISGALPMTMELGKGVQVGLVDRVSAGLALNEKTAGVTFPDSSGKLDFDAGFASDNPRFHKWCEDLFVFHWNKAKPMRRLTNT
jgi:predicted transcriptional regulator